MQWNELKEMSASTPCRNTATAAKLSIAPAFVSCAARSRANTGASALQNEGLSSRIVTTESFMTVFFFSVVQLLQKNFPYDAVQIKVYIVLVIVMPRKHNLLRGVRQIF